MDPQNSTNDNHSDSSGINSGNNSETNSEVNNEILKYAGPMSRVMRALSGFRMASYASDVGEATRGTFPNIFVNAMYAVTLSYIGADLYYKYKDNQHLIDDNDLTRLNKYMGYHTLWHAQASLLFPTVTIHSIVGLTRKCTRNLLWINPVVKRCLPVAFSLAVIPFIINPLDTLADTIMGCTYCRWTKHQPEKRNH